MSECCAECNGPFPQPTYQGKPSVHRGSPRRFCSKQCRIRHWNKTGAAAWRKDNSKKYPDLWRSRRSIQHLKHFHGITFEQYSEIHEAQKGLCAICEKPETTLRGGQVKGVLSVDHCHETGIVRGLLCNNCNRAIGLLKDNESLLRKAADYLGFKAMHHGS